MFELYVQIKFVHVCAVILSGSLFALRGSMMLVRSPLANATFLRVISYAIDTTLLTAALMLVTILHQYPFVQAWLTVKVIFLVIYIALGALALRRGRTRTMQVACYFIALTVFLFIVSVARTHNPWGVLSLLAS